MRLFVKGQPQTRSLPAARSSESGYDRKRETFPRSSVHTEISPLRFAPVEMTKERVVVARCKGHKADGNEVARRSCLQCALWMNESAFRYVCCGWTPSIGGGDRTLARDRKVAFSI
jgi:hypothetical protein